MQIVNPKPFPILGLKLNLLSFIPFSIAMLHKLKRPPVFILCEPQRIRIQFCAPKKNLYNSVTQAEPTLDKLVPQLKTSWHFIEAEDLLPDSKELAAGPYPKPHESNPLLSNYELVISVPPCILAR
jgi:hypothetical protein